MATVTIVGNTDAAHLSWLTGALIDEATPQLLRLIGNGVRLTLEGFNFTYDANDQLVGGSVRSIVFSYWREGTDNQIAFSASGFDISAAPLGSWVASDATALALSTVLQGSDQIEGNTSITRGDLIRGYGGNDTIAGYGGPDSLFGGDGNDQIYAYHFPWVSTVQPTGATFMRGEAGDDLLVGGHVFDNMHGNTGNDTVRGGHGDDWVVGGQDSDLLQGEWGNDIIYGNLAADTCHGGDGNDTIVAGQADDVVTGDAGADWLGGDKGADTISGGSGADTFRFFAGAGIDKITDFNAAEGDRILLEGGGAYSVTQVGADVVIDLGPGDQIILANVSQSSLTAGWIVSG